MGLLEIMSNLKLGNRARGISNRDQTKSHRDPPLHKHLNGLYHELDILHISQVNRKNSAVQIASNRRQLTRERALKVLEIPKSV